MASNLAIRAPEKKISSDVSIANLKVQEAEAWALHVAEAKKVRPKNTKNSLPPKDQRHSLTSSPNQSLLFNPDRGKDSYQTFIGAYRVGG